MEYINIVKKLHEAFPEFDVETVIKILEVIKSEETHPWIISNDRGTTIDKHYNPYNTTTDQLWTIDKLWTIT